MRKVNTAIWMRAPGEARLNVIGVERPVARKRGAEALGAEEIGTRVARKEGDPPPGVRETPRGLRKKKLLDQSRGRGSRQGKTWKR
jgi:hypothetical protein